MSPLYTLVKKNIAFIFKLLATLHKLKRSLLHVEECFK